MPCLPVLQLSISLTIFSIIQYYDPFSSRANFRFNLALVLWIRVRLSMRPKVGLSASYCHTLINSRQYLVSHCIPPADCQLLHHTHISQFLTHFISLLFLGVHVSHCIIPVSYTHLDVYKRQAKV